jgi:hypothetical protein
VADMARQVAAVMALFRQHAVAGPTAAHAKACGIGWH